MTLRWFWRAPSNFTFAHNWGGRVVLNHHLREGVPAHYQSYATNAFG